MSIVNCTYPDHKGDCRVDTDSHEVTYFCGKRHDYVICGDCKEIAWEVIDMLDDMKGKNDETSLLYAGTVKALVDAQTEIRTIADAARQGMRRQGIGHY